jgi:SAM-dependent methyltransferase
MIFEDRKDFLLKTAPWCLDHLEISNSEIILSGWVVPQNGDWDSVKFFINEKPCEVELKMDRSDLLEVFPFWNGVKEIGFKIRLEKKSLDPNQEIVVLSRSPNSTETKYSNYYFPNNEELYKNLPSAYLRTQVHGNDSISAFVLEGFSAHKKLELLFQENLGINKDKIAPVLDWGCGCGRVCKYFLDTNRIYGVDINKDGVDWCLENISSNFSVSELNPPLSFKDNYFGAIYGVSILTHLSLEDQRFWIQELIRITRPGGIIILSYHGLNSLIRFNLPEESFVELSKSQYLNIGKSDSLGKDSEVGSKYYDSVQLASSFDKIIPKDCTEVLFHESVFGNHQDVVVIKKNN